MRAQLFVAGVLALACGLSALLGGCSTTTRAGLRTIAQALQGGDEIDPTQPLDPQLQYLRVHIGRQVGLMVNAGEVLTPQGAQTRWYSADGVVLRLAQGRVAAIHDGARSWAWVANENNNQGPVAIDWQSVAAGRAQRFTQVSDRQPGYRIGVAREREIRVASQTLPVEVLEASRHLTASVIWFEERNTRGEPEPAWYAVDLSAPQPRVVFGQACLQADWCLSWQAWPPQMPQPALAP
jgi:hypothetical protein